MTDRRTLVDTLKSDAEKARGMEFINSARSGNGLEAMKKAATDASGASLSTRIRPDFVALLQRAKWERKLRGEEPNSLRDMLEEALEPWLRAHGYLQ